MTFALFIFEALNQLKIGISGAWCIRRVGGKTICRFCSKKLIRHGFSSSGKARYKCKDCKKTQLEYYSYAAYSSNLNEYNTTDKRRSWDQEYCENIKNFYNNEKNKQDIIFRNKDPGAV